MLMKLRTDFTKGILSKILTKKIKQNLGYRIDIKIQDLDVVYVDGKAVINTNVTLQLDGEELKELVMDNI